jgi:hypothetical protein
MFFAREYHALGELILINVICPESQEIMHNNEEMADDLPHTNLKDCE